MVWLCFSFSLKASLFSRGQVFSCEISFVHRLKCPLNCFLPICVFWLFLFYCCLSSLYCFLWLKSVFFCILLYSLLVIVSMHGHYLEFWQVLFFTLFLTHTVCQRHLWTICARFLSLYIIINLIFLRFSVVWQGPCNYLMFHFPLILLTDLL